MNDSSPQLNIYRQQTMILLDKPQRFSLIDWMKYTQYFCLVTTAVK